GAAAGAAGARLVPDAGGAAAAAIAGAHGDAIAPRDAPPLLHEGPDLFDGTERLVGRGGGVLRVVLGHWRGGLVLLVVAAADAAGLDAEQRVLGSDGRSRELAELEGLRLHQHGCAHRPGHSAILLAAPLPRGVLSCRADLSAGF